MSRDGSGNYSLPVGNPVTTGASISSSTHNSTMSDIATALTASLAKDGQTTPSANLPMGGFKHTGVATATARTDYCTAANAQDNAFDWITSVSGSDTITATAGLSMSTYAAGQTFRFVSAGANTGSATLNLNAIGAKAITKDGTTALIAGDIPSGATVEVIYDGTRFQMVGCVANLAKSGANSDITSITGLTTALTRAQGGTGLAVAGADGNVLTSNGTDWVSEALPAQKLVQTVFTQTGAVATGSTIMPWADTIPQITEGNEFLTQEITPTSATNYLEIEVIAHLNNSSGNYAMVGALFQDATTAAVAATYAPNPFTLGCQIILKHRMLAGTTSATTFKFRAGIEAAATVTFNGLSGARKLGGKMASSITIREVAA